MDKAENFEFTLTITLTLVAICRMMNELVFCKIAPSFEKSTAFLFNAFQEFKLALIYKIYVYKVDTDNYECISKNKLNLHIVLLSLILLLAITVVARVEYALLQN